MDIRYRIVFDEDYEPSGDEGIEEEETKKLAAGEWGAYGVIAETRCPCCKWGDKVASLWGIVVDAGPWVGTYNSPEEIQECCLRSAAEDLTGELS